MNTPNNNKKYTSAEASQIKRALEMVWDLVKLNTKKECRSCKHWNGTACTRFGDPETPPEHVQEHGCSKFEVDGIPF